MTKLKTPDLTVAQLAAAAGAVIGVLVAAGLPISDELQRQILNLVTVLSTALVGGDALIRHGRSRIAAAQVGQAPTATATITTGPPATKSSSVTGGTTMRVVPDTTSPAGFAPQPEKKPAPKKPTRKRPPAKPKGK